MKRTLRVLFLAVLAMTLMASVAFANDTVSTYPTSKSSFDVISNDHVSGVTLSSSATEVVVKVYVNTSESVTLATAVSVDVDTTVVNASVSEADGSTYSKDISVTITLLDTTTALTEANVTLTISSGEADSVDIVIPVTIDLNLQEDVSPDIESISVDSDEVTVAVDGTATVTATIKISGDNSYELTSSDITVTPDTEDIVEVAIGDPESADGGKTFTVEITVTGLAAGSTDLTVEVNNSTEFKDISATGTFTATVTETESSTSTFSWKDTSDLQEGDIVLYVDSEGEVVTSKDCTVTLTVPSDYDYTAVEFVVLDADGEVIDPENWSVTPDGGSKTDSEDVYAYVLTFEPSASQDKTTYSMYATDADGLVSTDTITFTVTVLVSSDASETDTTYTLKMEEPEVSATEIVQGQKATVKIAVTPMRATGTYTFSYDGDDDTFDVTEADEAQDTSAQTNYVEYTLQPDINATAGSYTFKFTVASGDEQTVSAEVTFTVSELDLENMSKEDRADFIRSNKAPAPGLSGSVTGGFSAGQTAKFTMTSKWPVHPKGWLVKFMYPNGRFFNFLMWLMRWLVGGEVYSANESALISVLGMIAEEDNAGAIQTDASTDSKSAEYTMEIDDIANGGLTTGTEFGVHPAVIPDKYYPYVLDGTVTSEDAASETEEAVGSIEGATDNGGGGTTTDEILPGSSGGCDAGFGTLALALAATLFLSKKRS